MYQSRVAIIIDEYSLTPAVWTAYMKHIASIRELHEVVLFVDENSNRVIEADFVNKIDIEKYSSIISLYLKLIKYKIKIIYVPHILLAAKLSVVPVFGVKVFLWLQGLLPEESFMRHRCNIRYRAISFIEKYSLNRLAGVVLVSNAMLCHIKEKYNYTPDKFAILPCRSDLVFDCSVTKNKNSFVYVGGASEWQKIDTVILSFIEIRKNNLFATLDFISRDIREIEIMLNGVVSENDRENINVFSLESRSEMASKLSEYKFGFLFRDDIPVNRVSSPIKYLEYLSCGIIPIMSNCIGDYSKYTEENNIGVSLKNGSELDAFKMIESLTISSCDILEKYNSIKSDMDSNNPFLNFFR